MAQSTIEWTDITWNPTTGCDKISAGCKNCYAEVMTRRLKAIETNVRIRQVMDNENVILPRKVHNTCKEIIGFDACRWIMGK